MLGTGVVRRVFAALPAAALLLATGAAAPSDRTLQQLHAANEAEIQLGRLALRQSQSPPVQQFARQMIEEHVRADAQLVQLAQQHRIKLTGPGYQEEAAAAAAVANRLSQLQAQEFDRAYARHMVRDHEKLVAATAAAAAAAREQSGKAVADFLVQSNGALQMHLERARVLEVQVGAGAARGRNP